MRLLLVYLICAVGIVVCHMPKVHVDGNKVHFKKFAHDEMLRYTLTLSMNASVDSVLPPVLISTKCAENDIISNITILMLTDSIGRMMVQDWCDYYRGNRSDWGFFVYKKGTSATQVCIIGKAILAFVHMYGSNKNGPYQKMYVDITDPYVHTEVRIKHAIQVFSELYGKPHFVLFRTDLWDIFGLITENMESFDDMDNSKLILHFLENYKFAVSEIRRLLPHAYIGTHTIPNIRGVGQLFFRYQNMLRYVSSSSNDIFLVDWHMLLDGHNASLHLRDDIHPLPARIIVFTNILFSIIERFVNVSC